MPALYVAKELTFTALNLLKPILTIVRIVVQKESCIRLKEGEIVMYNLKEAVLALRNFTKSYKEKELEDRISITENLSNLEQNDLDLDLDL